MWSDNSGEIGQANWSLVLCLKCIETAGGEHAYRTLLSVATLFPNEAPLLRLVSVVLAEVDEEWKSEKPTSTWKPIHQNRDRLKHPSENLFTKTGLLYHWRGKTIIAGGEHEYTKWMFRDLILQGKADLLNPDVSKLAGIFEAKKVAVLAETFDLPISVHNARPTLLTAAHFHYIVNCRTAHRPQEHPGNKRHSQLWKYFEDNITVNDGYGTISDEPGLGLVVNEEAVKRDAMQLRIG